MERTFAGTAPALSVVRAAYGAATAKMWLSIQLHDLSEYAGVKDKLSEEQISQLADVIMGQYYHLKVTEVMYYLQLVKSGKYGRYYGAVDPMAIAEGLRKFMAERADELNRIEQRRRELALEAERADRQENGISREEWEEVKWMFDMGYEPDRIRRELAEERAKAASS